ncbi:MAG: phosphatidylglycerol lysyltransferase domain-containing protein [Elusimicrobia bacterium]|nr:phosphatidylglycerol lysyltransferase domain-containing protein [Elusimicrobiota bacterium]
MDFDLLKPEHYARLKPFFAAQSQPLSAYSLASLVSWSQCIFDTIFIQIEDAVLFGERRMDDPDRKHLLLPACPNGPKPPAWLKDRAAEHGFREYHLVPQTYLDGFGRAEVEKLFTVTEETDYEDYVYRAAHLAELPGRDYAKKRNLVRQFERECVEPGRAKVDAISPANAGACLDCLEVWRSERGDKDWSGLLECERQAITKALQNFAELEFQGVMIAIDGKVRGFGIGSRLRDDTWVLHFEKASDQVKGLYQYLDRECAKRLFAGVTFLNKESDMGDPGLAQAKLSYRPAFRVKSYRLELR